MISLFFSFHKKYNDFIFIDLGVKGEFLFLVFLATLLIEDAIRRKDKLSKGIKLLLLKDKIISSCGQEMLF